MIIELVAAMSINNAIGWDNKLPWRIPEDLRRFKALTTGHPIIMGRKTYESIGRPLPNRFNIIVTKTLKSDSVATASNISEALDLARGQNKDRVFIIGGGQIYEQLINKADFINLTVVAETYQGDTWFPDLPWHTWALESQETLEATDSTPKVYFQRFSRRVW